MRYLLWLLVFYTCTASANSFQQYREHVSPNRLLLVFNATTTDAEKEEVIAQYQNARLLVHLPSPRASIIEVENRSDAEAFFSKQASVQHVSFFFESGPHTAGVLPRFFVKLKDAAFVPMLQETARSLGITQIEQQRFAPNTFLLHLPAKSNRNAIDACAQFTTYNWCDYAAPDYLVNPLVCSNDPQYNRQWHINNTGSVLQGNGTAGADMDVDTAWGITTGNADIKVVIIDSGVDTLHPDLAANILPGYDAVDDSTDGYPTPTYKEDGHGTCCAGIVGAIKDNNIGIAGVAPGCKIVPVRAFYYVLLQGASGPLPYSTSQAFANAIGWSWQVANGDVLSNSWGLPPALISFLPGGMQPVNDAIAAAHQNGRNGKGVALFFSSGNENDSLGPIWPASRAETIAVGATNMCDSRKAPGDCSGENWGADHGPGLDFSAPGVRIPSTDMRGLKGYINGDYYNSFNGTSAACPNAAAVGALVLSLRPELEAEDVRSIMARSCDKVGGYDYNITYPNGIWCKELGYGRINAYKALQETFNYNAIPKYTENRVQVFPNPANAYVNVLSENGALRVELLDMLGRVVQLGASETGLVQLPVDGLTAGLYVVSATTANRTQLHKIVINP